GRAQFGPLPRSVIHADRSPAPTPPEPSRSKLDTLGEANCTPFPKIRALFATDDAVPAPVLAPSSVNVTSPSAFENLRTVFAVQFVCAPGSIWSEQNLRSAQFERSITTEQPLIGLLARPRMTILNWPSLASG